MNCMLVLLDVTQLQVRGGVPLWERAGSLPEGMCLFSMHSPVYPFLCPKFKRNLHLILGCNAEALCNKFATLQKRDLL